MTSPDERPLLDAQTLVLLYSSCVATRVWRGGDTCF